MLPAQPISSARTFKVMLWSVLAVWILLFFFGKTNLAASDLGRHLMNGKIITDSGTVFQTNLYSFTNSDFSAPNHHWLFGVFVYWLHKIGSFQLVTTIVALCYWVGIMLMLWLSKRQTNTWIALTTAFLMLPVMAMRTETRPEAFSVLGLSLMIVLYHWVWKKNKLTAVVLAVACSSVFMVFWVNLHILFILGILTTCCYLLFAFINRSTQRIITFLSLLCGQLIAAAINPLGWRTILYPLQILRDYQYPVAENQSVLFFLQYHFSSQYLYLAIVLVATGLALVLSYKKVSQRLQPVWLLTALLLFATLFMNRFSVFFQLPTLIVLSWSLQFLLRKPPLKNFFSSALFQQPFKLIAISLIVAIIVGALCVSSLINPITPSFGIGVLPQVEAAGDFFRTNNLPGPIFNNYDIGGYLIYKLYPTQKVFVDNRPEAYSGSFMKEKYIAAQQDEALWQALEKQYQFNTIFFYRHDATDWALPFLIRRIQDDSWVPVYVDGYSLILVKKSTGNEQIIRNHQIDKSIFSFK